MTSNEAITLLRTLEDKLDSYCELNEEGKTAFRMAIEALSSSEIPNSSDTIYRQAAIDALHMHLMYRMGTDSNKKRLDDWINSLPSAQPEIIRCKDCKYWIPYDWMFSEVWQSRNIADYPEDEIGCNLCDMTMKADDFCSRSERREE